VSGELAVLGRENHRADDIAREQIGRELHALKLDAEGRTEGFDEQRLGEAGHAFKQDVAVGEERNEQAFDDGILADDGFGDFSAEFLGPSGTVEHERWGRLKKEKGSE
jgi:hypothetical protein